VIASDNPSASLGATISASVPAGTYYLRIDGAGFGTTTVGYSDYASVGQYTISGTVPQPAVNPPVADSQSVTTDEDTATGVTLAGSDPDGGAISYTVLAAPAHGTLGGVAPNLTYTPAANYNGSDSFTFRTSDGSLNSATATLGITVNAVNDAPLANTQSASTSKDTAMSITLTGSDVDGDALTFTVVASPANGTLSGTAPNLTYTPNTGFFGNDSLTFQANDGLTDSALATVSITVLEGPGPLPAGWTSQDVGDVGIAGTASYTSGTGAYTVSGSGIGFSTDQFRYAWQTLSGDGEIKARITGFSATTTTAQGGVMIRETTTGGSKFHFAGRRNDGKIAYARRSNTGGSVTAGTSGGAVALPYWVRVVRVGNTITSYKSANGVSWSKVNSANITMASQITIGLAVTSASNAATATVTFDNVTVVP
jgi:regulation of enolase protein 1 (concanavalin A-like superfamily)